MSIFTKVFRDMRAQVVGFGLFGALIAFLDVLIFPSYSRQFADFEFPAVFQAIIGEASFGTPEGFLTTEYFSWMPFLIVTFAIIQGTHAVSGEESGGTLDFMLAQPLLRWQFLVGKASAIALGMTLIALLSIPGFALGMLWVDLASPCSGYLRQC
jgi:ABC-type transport system involved in multi-copper enzyme maturation permease subunit